MPLEELVGGNVHPYVEVTRAGATLPCSAFARHAHPLTLVDAGRYLHLHRALRRAAAGTPTFGAGLLDDLPAPRAPQTYPGLDELSQHGPPDDPHLSPPSALGQVLTEEASVVPAPSHVGQTP